MLQAPRSNPPDSQSSLVHKCDQSSTSRRRLAIPAIRKAVVCVLFLVGLFISWRAATAILITRSIAPPGASLVQLVRSAASPPYQMAAPHLTLSRELVFSLVPKAQACTFPPCDGNTSENWCYPGCELTGCKCPFCDKYCTPRHCITVPNSNRTCASKDFECLFPPPGGSVQCPGVTTPTP